MQKIKQSKARAGRPFSVRTRFSLANAIASSVEKVLMDEGMPASKIKDIERRIVVNVTNANKSSGRNYGARPSSLVELLRSIEERSAKAPEKPQDYGLETKRPLTTQQLAQQLNLSRTHVINLLESGEIPFYLTPGGHRRISAEAADVYAAALKEKRLESLKFIAQASAEAGLYELD